MGYCVDVIDSDLSIRSGNYEKAEGIFVEHYKKYEGPIECEVEHISERLQALFLLLGYVFVEVKDTELDEWKLELDQRYYERWGEDEELFIKLAPLVEEGGYVRFQGQDGDMWGWRFRGGEMINELAVVTWLEGVPLCLTYIKTRQSHVL
jgi:hypothetical protein